MKRGEIVLYEGEESYTDLFYDDDTCRIANPKWRWDPDAEYIKLEEDGSQGVPFWIRVNVSELTLKQ